MALKIAIFLAFNFGCGDHIHLLKFADHENHGVAPREDREMEPHPRPILIDFYKFSEFFRHVLGTMSGLILFFSFDC